MTSPDVQPVLLTSPWGDWDIGSFTAMDLIAAATNAVDAALISRRPDHWKHYTIVGIILLALLGGLAGGISRDVLLNDIPAALLNPWYIIPSLAAGGLALVIAYYPGQRFREGLFQFATSLALPWFAVVGANKALEAYLPYISAVLIGIIGATAGRFLVDITAGHPSSSFGASGSSVPQSLRAWCT